MVNRYDSIRRVVNRDGIEYVLNPIYPEIKESAQDIYLIATVGDRYDKLALQYYGDSSLWWVIASSNITIRSGLLVNPGYQIRVPMSKARVLEEYSRVNGSR